MVALQVWSFLSFFSPVVVFFFLFFSGNYKFDLDPKPYDFAEEGSRAWGWWYEERGFGSLQILYQQVISLLKKRVIFVGFGYNNLYLCAKGSIFLGFFCWMSVYQTCFIMSYKPKSIFSFFISWLISYY